jgi:hypothetical protein
MKAVLLIRIGAFLPLDPDAGSGIGKKSVSGMNIQGNFLRDFRNIFWGLKILNSLMQIRIRDLVNPGSGTEKVR